MAALEDNGQRHAVELPLRGEQIGQVGFFLEERRLGPQEEDEPCVEEAIPLVPVACSLTSPRSRTANNRNCDSVIVTVSTEIAS